MLPDTGTTPLVLPGNPTLTTSAGGAGALHFEVSRGAPFVDGFTFDVIFRVVDLAGNTVLRGDCITVTVKWAYGSSRPPTIGGSSSGPA